MPNKRMRETPEKTFIRVADICREIHVDSRTVNAWIEDGHHLAGRLPAVDASTTGARAEYRIDEDDWRAFRERMTVPEKEKQERTYTPSRLPEMVSRRSKPGYYSRR